MDNSRPAKRGPLPICQIFDPSSKKIPHASEQLGLFTTTTEPGCLKPVLCNKRSHGIEKPVHSSKESPVAAASTRESPDKKQRRPNTAKNKLKKKIPYDTILLCHQFYAIRNHLWPTLKATIKKINISIQKHMFCS